MNKGIMEDNDHMISFESVLNFLIAGACKNPYW
jgi:hypothetical protein